MEEFLKKFSDVPNGFIDDFFHIANENYDDSELSIDFDMVVNWIDVRKDNLKRLLVENFSENHDYIIHIIKRKNQKNNGYHIREDIFITPDCFKELCMLSQTSKAKEVRRYYLSIERLIKQYHRYIQEKLYQKINLLETNQKPKVNINGGVIYFFRALNQIKIDELEDDLYKIGKTKNSKKRFTNYNSSNANDIEPLFIIEVNDIDRVENCIKNLLKRHQYRKHKEIYHIKVDALKYVFAHCSKLVSGFNRYMKNNHPDTVRNDSKKIRQAKHGLVLFFNKNV